MGVCETHRYSFAHNAMVFHNNNNRDGRRDREGGGGGGEIETEGGGGGGGGFLQTLAIFWLSSGVPNKQTNKQTKQVQREKERERERRELSPMHFMPCPFSPHSSSVQW